MTQGVNNNSGVNTVNSATLGPSGSLQLMFAKLQLELAETAKTQAMDRMDSISKSQDEQKLVSELLNEARQSKADAKAGINSKQSYTYTLTDKNGKEYTKTERSIDNAIPMSQAMVDYMVDDKGNIIYESKTFKDSVPKGNKATFMSQDMVDYMELHGLAYDKTANNYSHSADEWDVAIASLESRLEELGTDTQQQMVYIQDYMGQYNSYLQGANTQISNSNQTLTSLARGQ